MFCVIIGSLFTSQFSIVENDSSAVTYIDSEDKKAFNSDVSNNDAQKLAQSIEFKVYKIDETTSSESIYESPTGICQGFKITRGVDYTNSTYHYFYPGNRGEFYGSVVGATIYNQKDPQNLSYVPVYSITDKDLSKRIQLKENKTLKEKAANYVSEGRAVLTDVICK
ncbi:TPA: hypothetical protein ACPP4D_000039 [Haemophilus influenzae]